MILSDDEFEGRYGDWAMWFNALWIHDDNNQDMRFLQDMLSLGREASMNLALNIDFSVQPLSLHTLRFGFRNGSPRPRLRLDALDVKMPVE